MIAESSLNLNTTMFSNGADLQHLLNFAVDIARGAGAITLEYFKGSFQPERKADNSFVTIADRKAEHYLRERITAAFPDDGILGEEEGDKHGSSGHRWILDPIDGTSAFVHGVPLYAVLVGLEIDAEPVIGVVNFPALNEIVCAARGLGCWCNDKPAHVSTTSRVEEALLLCTDFNACEKYGFGPAAVALQRRAGASRTWGDAYGHVLVATGRAGIMLDAVMNVWDCAALLPILTEAGGTFTDWKGNSTIQGGNAISTNGRLFNQVMNIVTTT